MVEGKKTNKILDFIIIILLSALWITVFSTSTSPLYNNYEDDSAIFITIGQAMKKGYILYKDIFDHKGPILFFIQELGQIIKEGRTGIFIIQVVLFAVNSVFLFKIAKLFTSRKGAYLTFILSLIYLSNYFEEGNLTEEFSLPFISICIYIALKWFMNKEYTKKIYIYSAIYGISIGIISLMRLNNAAPIVGMLIGLIITFIKDKKIKELIRCGVSFLIGIGIIYIPIVLYFIDKNALNEMIYATFIHNFMYLKLKDNIFLKFANIFFIVLLLILNKKNKKLNLLITISTFITCIVVLLGRNYAHYFIIIMPLFTILLANYIEILKNVNQKFVTYIVVVFVIFLECIIPCLHILCYSAYKENIDMSSIDSLIDQNIPDEEKNSFLIFYNSISGVIYSRENMLPAYKYSFTQDNLFKSNEKIMIEMYEYLKTNNIKWIISCNLEDITYRNEVTDYIEENYKLIDSTSVDVVDIIDLHHVDVCLYEIR